MAQSTAGITLSYGESTVTNNVATVPATWTDIPDITGTPSMNASPAKLDSTTLAAVKYKTYISGLMDVGGSLEFPANMTPALVDAVDLAAAVPATGKVRAFKLSFPAPLSIAYWWTGEVLPVAPGEASVDAVATTTVYVSQESEPIKIDAAAVS